MAPCSSFSISNESTLPIQPIDDRVALGPPSKQSVRFHSQPCRPLNHEGACEEACNEWRSLRRRSQAKPSTIVPTQPVHPHVTQHEDRRRNPLLVRPLLHPQPHQAKSAIPPSPRLHHLPTPLSAADHSATMASTFPRSSSDPDRHVCERMAET